MVSNKIGIDEFLKMIEQNHFVEAHEVLEDDWKKFKKIGMKEEAKFLQALINGATSLALWTKKRPEASLRVWEVLQKNKHLIEIINLEDKAKYLLAINILESKFIRKANL